MIHSFSSRNLEEHYFENFSNLQRSLRDERSNHFSEQALRLSAGVVSATVAALQADLARRQLDISYLLSESSLPSIPVSDLPLTSAGEVQEKSPGDFVTQFDLDMNDHLTRMLTALRPIPIVSEEGPEVIDFKRLPECWLLDPLDGTTAYICGERSLCGPMVALLQEGEPILSVMMTLDGKSLWLAERGRGAVKLSCIGGGTCWSYGKKVGGGADRLATGTVLLNPQADLARSHLDFLSIQRRLSEGTHALAVERRVPHSMGALRLGEHARVAVIHDNSPQHPKQMPWDILPVKLWLEERGAFVIGSDGESYDIERPMPIIIAINATVAKELLSMASEYGGFNRP